MIVNEYGKYRLVCDICWNVIDIEFDNIQDAIDYRDIIEWRNKIIDSEYIDFCCKCVNKKEDFE